MYGDSSTVESATNPPSMLSIQDTALCINESTPDPFQQSFARSNAIDEITTFCNNAFTLDFEVVAPISFGNGKTPTGENKGMQFDNSISSLNQTVASGIWLNVRFFNEECNGSLYFAKGSNTAEKAAYCTKNFMNILDGCQNTTETSKYGGSLTTQCLYYQIQGRTPNTTDNYRLAQPGPLICSPS